MDKIFKLVKEEGLIFTMVDRRRRKPNYAPRFDIRTKSKTRKQRYWEALTGDFDSEGLAKNHFKAYLDTEYYTDQYNFGLFVKDSVKCSRLVTLLKSNLIY